MLLASVGIDNGTGPTGGNLPTSLTAIHNSLKYGYAFRASPPTNVFLKECYMATTKGMSDKLKKQVKSANAKRANAFSQAEKIRRKKLAK